MREILFRGKNCFGKWVEGFYYQAKLRRTDSNLCDYITIPHPKERGVPSDHHIVDSNTLGQYTGLTDKNGKRIFEGDIVKYPNTAGAKCQGEMLNSICEIKYKQDAASFIADGYIKFGDNRVPCFDYFTPKLINIEVIGNIHDNPELLKGGV